MDSYSVLQTLLFYLDELGESSINIMVYCFSRSLDWEKWLQLKQDVFFRCWELGVRLATANRRCSSASR